MNDRPSAPELIDAVRQHLETHLLPLARRDSHKLYFQTLVAVNVLRIVGRELLHGTAYLLAEWERLNALLGEASPPPARDAALAEALAQRNAALCARIRVGDYDQPDAAFIAHLHQCATEQLSIACPKVLAALAQEAAVQ